MLLVLRLLLGMLVAFLLLFSSFLGATFFAGWMLPLLFIQPLWYRVLLDSLVDLWKCYAASLLELLLGIKVVITGDQIKPGERCLLIMNHRTRLDWMYFWSVLVRHSGVKREKIILKTPLKHIPGAGWAMQVGTFIFIRRRWEDDKKVLQKMLDYFADLKYRVQVLLFPEGTDFTEGSKASSDRFASKNNLPKLEQVLHPRTTGFNYITQKMRDNGMLEAIYDVTVAYPYNFPQNETGLVLGNFPKEVHFHIKRHPVDTLPETEEGLAQWCQDRWSDKERKLTQFHKDKSFEPGKKSKDKTAGGKNPKMMLWIAFTYWTLFVIGILVILWYSWLARWFLIFQVTFYLIMGFRDGFEFFQVDMFYRLWSGRKRDDFQKSKSQ